MTRRKQTRPTAAETDEHVLSTEQILERLPINRTTLWKLVQEKRFPAPIHLTAHRIGWRWSAVLRWLAEREAAPLERRRYPRPRPNDRARRRRVTAELEGGHR
jgi:prophage regulatory protein